MEIRPFRAYRFNPQVVGNAGDCIVPPYDLSGRKQREYFYSKNKYNIIRIVSGISSEKDRNNDNQYTHAAQYLQEWIKTGALKQDASETIYGYVQNFTVLDRQYERTSFISLAKLEEYGQKV